MNHAFIYCPRCAEHLTTQLVGQNERPACSNCGYIQFPDPKVAVIGLITCGEKVLLTLRDVEPEKGKWSLPGGYMDAGEMPDEAFRREMSEEMQLEVGDLHFHSFLPMNGGRGIVIVYQTEPASGKCEGLTGYDDVAEARWFAKDSLPAQDQLAFSTTISLLDWWQHSHPVVQLCS